MGVLCVDFSKAFDSLEHLFIDNTLAFFRYRPVMHKMVATILNNRVSRVIMGEEIDSKINIYKGVHHREIKLHRTCSFSVSKFC